MRIKESILKLQATEGRKVSMADVASDIWPELKKEGARVRLSRIANGHANYVEVSFVKSFCTITGVTPNFLFGYE